MDLLSIILIAIGLAMDCFAVALCKGLAVSVQPDSAKMVHMRKPWLMAFLFGLFQGGMPLIGYYAGTLFAYFFNRFAPWIALVLLTSIGGKMIYESTHNTCDTHSADFALRILLSLAIATSIDALATGVIFIPYPEVLYLAVGIIALVSFLFAIIGFVIGLFAGRHVRLNVEMIGGIILILIGLKIFVEGICF